jgi:hypothetical protein
MCGCGLQSVLNCTSQYRRSYSTSHSTFVDELKDLLYAMAEGGAALPWGAPAHALAAGAVDPLADSDLHAISMEQLGLEAGARIEVCVPATAVVRPQVQDVSDTCLYVRRSSGRYLWTTRERRATRSAQQQHAPAGPHHNALQGCWLESPLLLLNLCLRLLDTCVSNF